MVAKIWFTNGLSSTADAIAMMRADPAARELSFMASHVDIDNPVREMADQFVLEPVDFSNTNYAEWVLETALQNKVAMIVVQRKTDEIWAARDEFRARGVRLQIAATPDVRALLDDKIKFQSDLASLGNMQDGAIGHTFCEFCSIAEFDTAWAVMSTSVDARHGLCAKPARGIFGSGFRMIEPDLDDMAQIVSTDPEAVFWISLAAYRNALAAAQNPVSQLLMPYLPGPERSVDFVASAGRLLYAVSRVKLGRTQRLETAGPSIEMARTLAARYRLNGMCNLQTREDSEGKQAVLEINPRMSGGMSMACLAGVNLPLISVLAGLGHDLSGFAEPAGGALVGTQSVASVLG